MKIADVMTPRESLVTVSIPGTREDALEYFQEYEFSSVPVVKETDDGEEFRGLVTRDMLIAEPEEDQLALLVEEVPTVDVDATMAELAALMRETGARRVPVLEGGELTGIVTITDVVRAIAEGAVGGEGAIGELAGHAVNTVYRGTPLPVAERQLAYADVAYAVVLDDEGTPEGMLTEVDIVAVARIVEGEENAGDAIANQDDEWMWEGIKAVGSRYMPTRNVEFPDDPVSEFMSSELVTISKRRTPQEAARVMIREDIEQIPLLSGDELVGIVRDMDLLEALDA
ncbi:CBS domain-containing protein [Natronomonas sp. EA1]|uniref:CBS domain-containing protein n=1 Tax=Natronomonas sp. EA1 TaxID=3421655 RepID=UPI003EC065A1